jgi:formylglycine-generating enzyme required for sulfatase activity
MVPYRERIPGTDLEFEMVPVPAGEFLMGSPDSELGRQADEGPQVRIAVPAMWVGKLEVTQQEFAEFEQTYTVFKEIARNDAEYKNLDRDRADVVTAPTEVYDPATIWEYGEGPELPAVAMTQYTAMQYTKWLSGLTNRQYRLPCEAEWEYACRGGSIERFSWGNDEAVVDQYAWYFNGTGDGLLSRGGLKQPNAFGLYDMHGNVGEWTVNAYTPNGYAGLSTTKTTQMLDSIRWPTTATACVVRGGTINDDLVDLRCAARMKSDDELWKQEDADFPKSPWWFSSDPALTIGFRLCRSVEPLDASTIARFWNHTAEDVRHDVQSKLDAGRGAVGIVDEELRKRLEAKRAARLQSESPH